MLEKILTQEEDLTSGWSCDQTTKELIRNAGWSEDSYTFLDDTLVEDE